MKAKKNYTLLLTTIVCLIPVIAGIVLYSRLPDMLVTHWDMEGNANGWEPKYVGAIVFPGILVILNLIFPVLLKVDPKYTNMDSKVKTLLHWIIPLVSVFCSGTTLAAGLGNNVNVPLLGTMLIGVIFIAIGNYLPKTSQSYTVGIKLPWTLYSEENWDRTHRMAGFIWVICGFAAIVSGIFGFYRLAFPMILIIAIGIPVVYSYLLYRKGI